MKALVISDKQEIINSVSSYLDKNNFDVIVYRWLLKALDNIEEIQPDIIFLSSSEYPRHWKTLASFVQSGIGGNEVKLFLYDPEKLSDEEEKKAIRLGVEAFINSLDEEELKKLGSNKVPVEEVQISANAEIEEDKIIEYELVFTDPLSGKFEFGRAFYNNKTKLYDFRGQFDNLKKDQEIRFISLYDKNNSEIKAFSADVLESDLQAASFMVKANKYYDEEI